MPKVQIRDIDIYYEVHGHGEDLLLIAGFAGSTRVWFRQIPELSRWYRVIAFDNRGSGESDKPDIPYSMSLFARDTVGLLDALDIDNAHIYGISMGGMIAQEFALRYPERVNSLTLGCTSCGGRQFVLPDQETLDFLLNIKHVGQLTPEERIIKTLPYSYTQEFIDRNPDIVQEYISIRVAQWPPLHSFLRQAEAVVTHNTYDRLPDIAAPTLVISGDADRQVPVENSKILASRIPGAELVILDNMGHGLPVEAAEEANNVVIDFLRRHPKAVLPAAGRRQGSFQPLRSV
jgi:pimeloyl-ACP methyl ester carboxylesterase